MSRSERLPALKHRDFRNFVFGSLLSNIGGQVQTWAIAWHLYHLTGSSLAVGTVGLVRVVPLLGLGLFGGVVADQFERRGILIITQLFQAAIAIALVALTLAGQITQPLLYVAVGLGAAAQAFNGPARQAMVAGLVPPKDFPNAASVNGIQWRLSEVLGPALAGLLIGNASFAGMSGLSLCYLINAVSFIAIIGAVYLIPRKAVDPSLRASSPKEVLRSIGEGFQFIRKAPVLRSAMWIDFWATLLSGANALLPAFAGKVLNLGPEAFGLLAASSGVGAMVASVVLAWSPTIHRQGRWVIIMIGVYGLFTLLFGLSPNLFTAGIFLAVTGAADMISTVLRQTIRQLSTPDEMRGRMSAMSMLFHVTGPQLGDFEAGVLATLAGERISIAVGGIGAMGVSGWYWVKGRALKGYVHQWK